ncbi:siderophore-interacting protein [Nesterenkonia marinintestina]|uniref:siderophore-interacting protein n=1 Tax=Nesterenkonia marinintestina TaxID=2979865 RepID=UPI0021BEA284|nr:siderophore-interacting protein [Nesterenkonia sp. GX14115]
MRAFDVRVSRIRRLSPHFVRFTFGGESLRRFAPTGLDQRIKLIFPLADGSFTDLGLFDEPAPAMMTWYAAWRALPDEERNPIRTYTVRHIRREHGQIDVDFVLHTDDHGDDDGADGPAASWAARATVGDRLIVIGPALADDAVIDARGCTVADSTATEPGSGVEWYPGAARRLLIVADETAVPAAASVLESLGPEYTGEAFLEVPTAGDVLDVRTDSQVQIRWLPREGGTWGAELDPAVRDWGRRRVRTLVGAGVGTADGPQTSEQELPELPEFEGQPLLWEVSEPGDQDHGTSSEDDHYAWLAGEAGAITALRRHLVKDLGISRRRVSFMGYWRRGRPSA